ncbi:MAG: VanZ family protein [Candidatus Aminicenantes bacterium]|nr:VanZ family protein [Candidatus Aminicenantes bacterium]
MREVLTKPANRPQLWLILTIIWMAVIFVLSTNYFSSERTTDLINIHIPLRSLAHLFVYFVLGFLASGAIKLNFNWKHKLLITLLFCIFYALTDELHQYFETERRFGFTDIATDSVGASVGILFYKITKSLHIKIH